MRVPLLILACVCCLVGVAVPVAQAAPRRPLSFLHVARAGGPAGLPQVVDRRGRQLLLKGVNVDGIVDYWRPDLRVPYTNDPAAYRHGRCPADDPTIEGVR